MTDTEAVQNPQPTTWRGRDEMLATATKKLERARREIHEAMQILEMVAAELHVN